MGNSFSVATGIRSRESGRATLKAPLAPPLTMPRSPRLQANPLGSHPVPTRVRFDRFYTYAELQETLEAWAGSSPACSRSSRSASRTKAGRSRSRRSRTSRPGHPEEAGGLRPRPDPRDGVHRDDRGSQPARSAPPWSRQRRARDAGARHAHLLHRPAREPGRCGRGARRRALPALERASVPPRRAAGRAPPGRRRRRRAGADDAASRPERLLEAAPRRRAAPDRAPAGRLRRRVLPRVSRGHDSELGRRDRHDRPRARGPRPEPELARRLGAGGRPARRRPVPHVRARGARARRGDRRSEEHHELHRLPHLLRRAPAPLLGPLGRGLPDHRPASVQAHGRGGDPAHRLPVDLDLPRLQVRPQARHQGRRHRLDLRLPRRVRVGDRSSGARSDRPVSRITTSSIGSATTRPTTTARS